MTLTTGSPWVPQGGGLYGPTQLHQGDHSRSMAHGRGGGERGIEEKASRRLYAAGRRWMSASQYRLFLLLTPMKKFQRCEPIEMLIFLPPRTAAVFTSTVNSRRASQVLRPRMRWGKAEVAKCFLLAPQ